MISKQAIREWREYPAKFVWDCFGVKPDPWQLDALRAFAVCPRIAMKACKGPGKTATLAWLGWNFLATRPNVRGAAVSITADNLSNNLWPEFAKWQERSPFLQQAFTWQAKKIFANSSPATHFLAARTWSKTADKTEQSNTLAGLHEDYIIFLLDESAGIPQAVVTTAEAAESSAIECRIVQAGNPTHLEGPLYAAVTSQRDLWHVIDITGDPDDPNRSPRISIEWARQQIKTYGADNPWVLVNVFGKFPPASINALLGPDDINPALGKHLRPDEYDFAAKVIGIDVARFGNDRTVLFPRQGLAAFRPVIMRNARTNEIAARAVVGFDKWGADGILVDDTGGWGAGVVDSLIMSGHPVWPVNFASKATDGKFFNLRSELHFKTANWIKRGAALPNIPGLVAEATALTYTFQDGKFRVEEKDHIKEKIGYSPDMWDALATSHGQEIMPRPRTGIPEIDNAGDRLQHEWNPFDDKRM